MTSCGWSDEQALDGHAGHVFEKRSRQDAKTQRKMERAKCIVRRWWLERKAGLFCGLSYEHYEALYALIFNEEQ